MSYRLGLDIGTTFSAAAIWRDGRVEVISFEASHLTVPTVVFAKGDHMIYGTPAASRGFVEPEGVAREFKRRLGDPVAVMLSGSPYSADRLIAMFVRWVVDAVGEQLGEHPDAVVMTHPANWTQFQLNLLRQALSLTRLEDVELYSEPEAAVYDYAATAHVASGQLVLVYDLGGGTFDVAVLRRTETGFEFVGDPAGVERLGGIDFDEAVFHDVLRGLPAATIERAKSSVAGRMALAQLRRACVEAKEQLSSDSTVDVPVVLPEHATTYRLTRVAFEEMIRPALGQTVDLVRQVLARADVRADELSAILLIGGTSRTPLVGELLVNALGVDVRVDAHPKLVVARGAARRAAAIHAGTSTDGARRSGRRRAFVAAGLVVVALLVAGGLVWAFTRSGTTSQSGGLPGSSPAEAGTAATVSTSPPTSSVTSSEPEVAGPTSITAATPIGTAEFPADVSLAGGLLGGLSGIIYDVAADRFLAVSDDAALPRLYELAIDLDDGALTTGDVEAIGGTTLRNADGSALPANSFKGEAVALTSRDTVVVAGNGDPNVPAPPPLREFGREGRLRATLTTPTWYHPNSDGSSGVVPDGSFWALAMTPTQRLVAGARIPLAQELTAAAGEPPIVRLLVYDDTSEQVIAEYGYPVDGAVVPSASTGTTPGSAGVLQVTSRLEDLVAVDESGTMVALEISTEGTIQTAHLYEFTLPADDSPPSSDRPIVLEKKLLADIPSESLSGTEFQGMALGPVLNDGRRSLVLVSDNDFGVPGNVATMFTAYALELTA